MLAGAVALAAGLALAWYHDRVNDAAYVSEKGTPAVRVLVKRDGQTRAWDEHRIVHPGDSLALQVACMQFPHAGVASWSGSAWVRLWDGPCVASLPFTLVVDRNPGNERISVVLANEPVTDAMLRSVENGSKAGRWFSVLDLAKEVTP
jgi:hypothetical protein